MDRGASTQSDRSAPTDVGARRRRIQIGLAVLWVVAFATATVLWGLPASRDRVSVWLLSGLLVASLDRRNGWMSVVTDFLPLVVVLAVYDWVRGFADGLVGHVFTYPQLRADEWLFGGTVPTITLQHAFWEPGHAHVWDYAAFLVYLSYFLVPFATAAVLWKFRHDLFRRYAALWVGLAWAAVITYALYPATPPWLASRQGHLAHVARITPLVSKAVGADLTRIMGSRNFVNNVAAVPSLHAATVLLISLFLWPQTKRWRWLLALYPVAMGLSLVYLGEHYVSDVLLGWVYAVAVYVFGNRIHDRWVARRPSPHALTGAPDPVAMP